MNKDNNLLPDNPLPFFDNAGLVNPGDNAYAYITPKGNQVFKYEKTIGNKVEKGSATRYPSTGTIHLTKTIKSKKIT